MRSAVGHHCYWYAINCNWWANDTLFIFVKPMLFCHLSHSHADTRALLTILEPSTTHHLLVLRLQASRLVLQTINRRSCTITEKALLGLKAATTAFTFQTLWLAYYLITYSCVFLIIIVSATQFHVYLL